MVLSLQMIGLFEELKGIYAQLDAGVWVQIIKLSHKQLSFKLFKNPLKTKWNSF